MSRTLNAAFASTEEVAAAAGGVTRHTLRRWCDKGALPEPTLYGVARGGTHNRWPAWAVARARWVRGMLDQGYTLDEVAKQAMALGDAPTP
jgi:DNA-binding transcriptional MerR regulator